MVANEMMKKKDRMRRGRFRTSSIQRSLTFTFSVSSLAITILSLLSKKQNMSRARPVRANMLMVMNHA